MLLVLRNCFIEYSYTYNNRDFKQHFKQLAKKYGYVNHQRICEYIAIYKNREEILKRTEHSAVSLYRALKVLRELKLSFFAEHFLS